MLKLTLVAVIALLIAVASGYTHNRHFWSLGTGRGNNLWKNGSIPYVINVTKQKNKDIAKEALIRAANHIREKTCVDFFEVTPQTWKGRYVNVRDTVEGSCSAGGAVLNFDGCGSGRGIIMHEMLHIVGIGHEQKRIDSYDKLKMYPERIKEDFVSQYTPTSRDAHGEYDFNSIMHYGNSGFNNGNGDTYESTRVDFGVGCGQLSKGDIETVQFVSQNCYKDTPMRPRCRASSPSYINVGKKFNQNISFTALYMTEKLTANITNLPEGATVHNHKVSKGAIYLVEIKPTANDAGKEFNVTATFKTSDDQTVECKTLVRVIDSNYVCNNVPSTSPSVCSGHGVCNSNVFPQCQCEAGYEGPFCEGVTRCPRDIAMDYEGSDQAQCMVPIGNTSPNYVKSPNGWAINGTKTQINFASGSSIIRQPSEVSFLTNFIGKGRYYLWLNSGTVNFNMYSSKLGNVEINKWSFVRFAFDWKELKYTAFVNGEWAKDGDISSNDCSSLTNKKCSIGNIIIKGLEPDTLVVQMDRIRVRCGGNHIAATTNKELSAKTLVFEPVQLTLTSPSHNWVTSPSGLCTATDPKVLEGAKYTASGKILTITIPAVGDKPQSPVTQYITCNPKPEHFGASSSRATAVEIAPDNAKVFAIKGLCPANEKFEHKDIKDRKFGQNPVLASPRPASIKYTIDITSVSSWECRIRRSGPGGKSDGDVINLWINSKNKRISISNRSKTTHIEDDRIPIMSKVEFTLKLDWAARTMTLEAMDKTVADVPFNATGFYGMGHWFWSGAANGTGIVETTCPPADPVEMPQLYDPKFVSAGSNGPINLNPGGEEQTLAPGDVGSSPAIATPAANNIVLMAAALFVILFCLL